MRLYQLLIRLLSPLIVLLLILDGRKRTPNAREFWRYLQQRLGWGYPTMQTDHPPIWIHCASVGEFKAAEPLIAYLHDQQQPLLITTNTPTAAHGIAQRFPQLNQCYLPFDWPSAIRRFLKHLDPQPEALWVVETEIWPNLFRIAHQHSIPITLLNGRLSAKTLNAPHWLQQTYRETLTQVDQVLVRDTKEAQRFAALGHDNIQVLPNLKFAHLANTAKLNEKSQNPQSCPAFLPKNRTFVLLASSHEDEEKQIVQRWLPLKRSELLVIVPRHSQRGRKVAKQLRALLKSPQQLALLSENSSITLETQILIVDKMHTLEALFACAKLVIMGGSFVPKGGHNLLEPAARGKPIITGPDMSDFESETALLKAEKGILQVEDYAQLITAITNSLENLDQLERLGHHAQKTMQQMQQKTLMAYLKALKIV